MANSLLSGRCLPSEVRSFTGFRHPLHAHTSLTRRSCKPLRQQIDRSTKVQAHATEAPAKSKVRPGEKKGAHKPRVFQLGSASSFVSANVNAGNQTAGFVEEMRFVAMKLHTKDQAPKEGGKAASPQPFQKVLKLVAVVV